MDKRPRIILVYTNLTSFVKTDLDILRKFYDVECIRWRIRDVANLPKFFWKDVTTDLNFIWFASGHAFRCIQISKLLGKKSVVVVGGFEVANIPEINYGLSLSPKYSQKVKFVFENADAVLTVDDSLKQEAINNLGVSGENIFTIPTGYDSKKWLPGDKKEDLVITVAFAESWNRARLKGLDLFVKIADLLPEVKFVVIGATGEALSKLTSISSKNVEFIKPLSQNELLTYYQKAKVYCQLSMHEGLPNALCEAMLCECVPVGTEVNGIPKVIGNTGFYVPYGNIEDVVEAINQALISNNGKKARKRIKEMFTVEKREQTVHKIINKVISE